MQKKITTTLRGLGVVMALAALGAIALPEDGHATTVCYRFDSFTAERWVLDVKSHSVLSTGQKAYSVHGKEVGGLGPGSMSGVYGTVVVNKNVANPPVGAHMSIQDSFIVGEPVFLEQGRSAAENAGRPPPAVTTSGNE